MNRNTRSARGKWLLGLAIAAVMSTGAAEPPRKAGDEIRLEPRDVSAGEKVTPLQQHSLTHLANRYRHSLFLVLSKEESGTAFLISRHPPLLATAAHVADAVKKEGGMVILNETQHTTLIKRIYLHPHAHGQDGKIRIYGPDVAVLEVENLPLATGEPLPLASPARLHDIVAQRVATLGFPFYTGRRLRPVAAIFEGTVARLLDFKQEATAPLAQRWLVETTLQQMPQQSGSPVFLEDGSVMGISHASMRANLVARESREKRGILIPVSVPYAVRVDALWELLVDANLARFVQGKPEGLVRIHTPVAVAPLATAKISPQELLSSAAQPGKSTTSAKTLAGWWDLRRKSGGSEVEAAGLTIEKTGRLPDGGLGFLGQYWYYRWDGSAGKYILASYPVQGLVSLTEQKVAFKVNRGGRLIVRYRPSIPLSTPWVSITIPGRVKYSWAGEPPLMFTGRIDLSKRRMWGRWSAYIDNERPGPFTEEWEAKWLSETTEPQR